MKKIIPCMLFILLLVCQNSFSAERIFYENCEKTKFVTHFMEDNYGSGVQAYFDDMVEMMDQSPIAHTGNYSMSYQPWVDRNPHTIVGLGSDAVPQGNLSGFDLESIYARIWYFRWYQRWESGYPDQGLNKLLYINYGDAGTGTFTFWLNKTNATTLRPQLRCNDNYDYTCPGWNTYPSIADVDDENWHKFEVIIDTGTNQGVNAHIQIKVDNVIVSDKSNFSLTSSGDIDPNPIKFLTGWPSNVGGTDPVINQRTWVDDLEIYTLTSFTDIPPEIGGTVDNPPRISLSVPSTTTSSTIDLTGTSSDDNGVTSITWSNNRGGSGTVGGDLSTWTVTGIALLEGENLITVTASDGVNSPVTDTATVTYNPPAVSAPPAPGGTALIGLGEADNQLSMTWEPFGGSAVTQYRLLRNGAEVVTTTSTSYIDSGLVPATQYTYTVIALDGSGNTLDQIVLTATTP